MDKSQSSSHRICSYIRSHSVKADTGACGDSNEVRFAALERDRRPDVVSSRQEPARRVPGQFGNADDKL